MASMGTLRTIGFILKKRLITDDIFNKAIRYQNTHTRLMGDIYPSSDDAHKTSRWNYYKFRYRDIIAINYDSFATSELRYLRGIAGYAQVDGFGNLRFEYSIGGSGAIIQERYAGGFSERDCNTQNQL